MSKKIQISLIAILTVVIAILWVQKNQAYKEAFQSKQEMRKGVIYRDSLVKLADGYYQKLVADTLTRSQLNELARQIVDIKKLQPVSVTTTVIKPINVVKETNEVKVSEDSISIQDFYPNKDNPFLTYKNKLSLTTQSGVSTFDFNEITLKEVISKKENGLYQVDFKGPPFIQVKSINIQTEPIEKEVKDKKGVLIGLSYGTNLDSKESSNFVELNVYQRYNKFYIGGGVDTNKNVKGGVKIEL